MRVKVMETAFWKGRVRLGLNWGKMGGRTWSPTKFPEEQFTVMDEYPVAVKFQLAGCVCWRRWNAEWFQRALKLPWIWFSVPTRVSTAEGLFFGVCRGKHWVSAFRAIKRRPPSPSSIFKKEARSARTLLTRQFIRFIFHPAAWMRTYLTFLGVCLASVLMCWLLFIYLSSFFSLV